MNEKIPRIILPEKSNAEYAKCWLNDWKKIEYEPVCKETAIQLRTILTELSKYVTVIGFTEDGELGIMDIDLTVKDYMDVVDSVMKGKLRYV